MLAQSASAFICDAVLFRITCIRHRFECYVAGIIALALNNAAFTSEIWRAAIMDFAAEQLDAAKSVGMTWNTAWLCAVGTALSLI
jgi:ABC-type amino acid transport system permease subunit